MNRAVILDIMLVILLVAGILFCEKTKQNGSLIVLVSILLLARSISFLIRNVLLGTEDSTKKGNWLIMDKGSGRCVRHWILLGLEVKFSDSEPDSMSLKSLSGVTNGQLTDATVVLIGEPIEEFTQHYKKTYDIPADQEPIR